MSVDKSKVMVVGGKEGLICEVLNFNYLRLVLDKLFIRLMLDKLFIQNEVEYCRKVVNVV